MAPSDDKGQAQVKDDFLRRKFQCEESEYAIDFCRLSESEASDTWTGRFKLRPCRRDEQQATRSGTSGRRSASIDSESRKRTTRSGDGSQGSNPVLLGRKDGSFSGGAPRDDDGKIFHDVAKPSQVHRETAASEPIYIDEMHGGEPWERQCLQDNEEDQLWERQRLQDNEEEVANPRRDSQGGSRRDSGSSRRRPSIMSEVSDDEAASRASSRTGGESRKRTSSMEPMLIREEEGSEQAPFAPAKNGMLSNMSNVVSSLFPTKKRTAAASKQDTCDNCDLAQPRAAPAEAPSFAPKSWTCSRCTSHGHPRDQDTCDNCDLAQPRAAPAKASSSAPKSWICPRCTSRCHRPDQATRHNCDLAQPRAAPDACSSSDSRSASSRDSSSEQDVCRAGFEKAVSPPVSEGEWTYCSFPHDGDTDMECDTRPRRRRRSSSLSRQVDHNASCEQAAPPVVSEGDWEEYSRADDRVILARRGSTPSHEVEPCRVENESATPERNRKRRDTPYPADALPYGSASFYARDSKCQGLSQQQHTGALSRTPLLTFAGQRNDQGRAAFPGDAGVPADDNFRFQRHGSRSQGKTGEQSRTSSRQTSSGMLNVIEEEGFVKSSPRCSGSRRHSHDEPASPPNRGSQVATPSRKSSADMQKDDEKPPFAERQRSDIEIELDTKGLRRQSLDESATSKQRGSQRQSYEQAGTPSRKSSVDMTEYIEQTVSKARESRRQPCESADTPQVDIDMEASSTCTRSQKSSRKEAVTTSARASRGSQPKRFIFKRAVCRFTHPDASFYCGLPAQQEFHDSCRMSRMVGRDVAALSLLLEQADAAVSLVRSHQGHMAEGTAEGMAQLLADLSAALVVCSCSMGSEGHVQTIGETPTPVVLMLLVRLVEVLDALIPLKGSADGIILPEGGRAVGGEAFVGHTPEVLGAFTKALRPRGFLRVCMDCLGDDELHRRMSAIGAGCFMEELDILATLALTLVLSWEPPSSIPKPRDMILAGGGYKIIVHSMEKLVSKLTPSRSFTVARLALTLDAARLSLCSREDMEHIFGPGGTSERDGQGDESFSAIVIKMAPLAAKSIEHLAEDQGEVAEEAVGAALPAAVRLLAVLLDIPAAWRGICTDNLARTLLIMLRRQRLSLNLSFAIRDLVCREDPKLRGFGNLQESEKIGKAVHESFRIASLPSRLAVAAQRELRLMLDTAKRSGSPTNVNIMKTVKEWSAQVVAAGLFFDSVQDVALKVHGSAAEVEKEMANLKRTCAEFDAVDAESGSESSGSRRSRQPSITGALGSMRQKLCGALKRSPPGVRMPLLEEQFRRTS
eukprot:TRINITY_DN9804_c0_g1_i1.p1 TRINITY_DN9804_c0_g1~~TRINITY_DN9804_c0_g1_i1.p1  ORF type:complete len:1309 (+),score=215.19 TRINITY_DN9804_c0_g1_i1:80-4006(+)